MNTTSIVEVLEEDYASRLAVLSPEERRAGMFFLSGLASGELVTISQLAQAFGITVGTAQALVREPALKPLLHIDEEGQIVAFMGLTCIPAHHQFTTNGRTLWTWCALDALFLPELLGSTAAIESRDPETGELVRLTISAAGIEAAEPKDTVVSLARPDTWDLTSAARVRESACHFIFFFASRVSGERWIAKQPGKMLLLSLEEAFALGQRTNAHLFGRS